MPRRLINILPDPPSKLIILSHIIYSNRDIPLCSLTVEVVGTFLVLCHGLNHTSCDHHPESVYRRVVLLEECLGKEVVLNWVVLVAKFAGYEQGS